MSEWTVDASDGYGEFVALPADFIEERATLGGGLGVSYVRPKRKPGTQPLLFIHGIASNWRTWYPVASDLADEFDVILVDLPGFGRSDRPDGPLLVETAAVLLSQLLDALEVGPVAIVGHSMGSLAAIHFAASYPDRVTELVLVAGHLISAVDLIANPTRLGSMPELRAKAVFAAQLLGLAVPMPGGLRAAALSQSRMRDIILRPFFAHPNQLDARVIDLLMSCIDRRSVLSVGINAIGYDYRDHFSLLVSPVTLVIGSNDLLIPATDTPRFQAVVESGVVTLSGTGHWLPLENPSVLANTIRRLLTPT